MPIDKVVYVLGAGFSAPLGIPVMSNFLVKSKDMYFASPERFSHFQKVFDRIRSTHVALPPDRDCLLLPSQPWKN